MNLTRQQKILLGVLCLGGSAVLVDRVWLTESYIGPQQAAADVSAMAQSPQRLGAAEIDLWLANAEETVVSLTVADRLGVLAEARRSDDTSTRNAFSPPTAWLHETEPDGGEKQSAHQDHVRRFFESHRLDAVMTSGGSGVAIINGRALQVGQQVDGFTLVEVESQGVVFISAEGDVRVVLPLRASRP